VPRFTLPKTRNGGWGLSTFLESPWVFVWSLRVHAVQTGTRFGDIDAKRGYVEVVCVIRRRTPFSRISTAHSGF